MMPIEEPRQSKLTFAGSWEPSQPIDLSRLSRLREPVSRSKSGVRGKIADVLFGRSRHAESQNELRAFRILVATARADAWQEQPFFLEYNHYGKKHRYTPDLLVAWGPHKEVVEIKEDRDAELPENQERFGLIRELLTEYGYYFRVRKRSEIRAEPRLMNASLTLRYRCVEIPAPEHENIRRAFCATPESTLGRVAPNTDDPSKHPSPRTTGLLPSRSPTFLVQTISLKEVRNGTDSSI